MEHDSLIRSLRLKAGISREELVRRTGISYESISRYETEDNPFMSIGRLLELTDALGFTLEIIPKPSVAEALKQSLMPSPPEKRELRADVIMPRKRMVMSAEDKAIMSLRSIFPDMTNKQLGEMLDGFKNMSTEDYEKWSKSATEEEKLDVFNHGYESLDRKKSPEKKKVAAKEKKSSKIKRLVCLTCGFKTKKSAYAKQELGRHMYFKHNINGTSKGAVSRAKSKKRGNKK